MKPVGFGEASAGASGKNVEREKVQRVVNGGDWAGAVKQSNGQMNAGVYNKRGLTNLNNLDVLELARRPLNSGVF